MRIDEGGDDRVVREVFRDSADMVNADESFDGVLPGQNRGLWCNGFRSWRSIRVIHGIRKYPIHTLLKGSSQSIHHRVSSAPADLAYSYRCNTTRPSPLTRSRPA